MGRCSPHEAFKEMCIRLYANFINGDRGGAGAEGVCRKQEIIKTASFFSNLICDLTIVENKSIVSINRQR